MGKLPLEFYCKTEQSSWMAGPMLGHLALLPEETVALEGGKTQTVAKAAGGKQLEPPPPAPSGGLLIHGCIGQLGPTPPRSSLRQAGGKQSLPEALGENQTNGADMEIGNGHPLASDFKTRSSMVSLLHPANWVQWRG